MGYRVRSADGEISFEQFADLEKAYRSKLVDPEDEVQGDGESGWTPAGQIPLLKGARSDVRMPGEARRWYAMGLGLCLALAIVTWGATGVARHFGVGPWAIALPVVVVVLAVGLTQMSYRALRHKGRRPYGR